MELDEVKRELRRAEEEFSEAKRENERLKQELAKLRELHEFEEGDAGGTRKRKIPRSRSKGGTVARLPTDVWTMIAANIKDNDVMAFALTSKQHRQAQQQAGRKLVTRPWYRSESGNYNCHYFTEDWCAWWSRRFNMTETVPECMNRVIRIAAYRGYLDVRKTYWSDIPEEKKPLLLDEMACGFAAFSGHLETLQWLRSQGCPWDQHTCFCAAMKGHLKCLQWLRSEGCPCSENTCLWAARHGHLQCLQWARQNGCPWNENRMCEVAAYRGQLAVLKWVREQGCPWGETTTLKAAMNGHLKCFRWLMFKGCPCDIELCRFRGKANVTQWIREQENLE